MAKGRAKPVKKKSVVMAPPSPYWRSPVRKWLLSYLKPDGERYRTNCTGTYADAADERDKCLGLGKYKGQATSNYLDCWMIDTGEDVWRKNMPLPGDLALPSELANVTLVPSTREEKKHEHEHQEHGYSHLLGLWEGE